MLSQTVLRIPPDNKYESKFSPGKVCTSEANTLLNILTTTGFGQ